jgi:hypothetical protein
MKAIQMAMSHIIMNQSQPSHSINWVAFLNTNQFEYQWNINEYQFIFLPQTCSFDAN